MKVISVTPAGRRRYLEILASYLLRHRDVIDEHHWWLNTRDPEDIAYIYRLADQYPDFFRVVAKPIDYGRTVGARIWDYVRSCTDPDAIFVRLDDDICYVADHAIADMVAHRRARPEPFLILGNVINNAVCSYHLQQAGYIPKSWGQLTETCLDDLGWRSGEFARKLHQRFLNLIDRKEHERWRQAEIPINGRCRYSVNAICWFGKDMAKAPECGEDAAHEAIEEEIFLTEDLPTRLKRPNEVCPQALFGHYAFYPQRDYLEWTAPSILARYREIALSVARPSVRRRPALTRAAEAVRYSAGVTAWHARKQSRELTRGFPSLRSAKSQQKAA